jgi:uncharacterized coiled-coil protein SlyX
MTVDTWIQAGLALVGAGGGVVAARSARRTKRQERRDDFTAVTEQQGKQIERLEKRVALREREAEQLGQRLTDQDEAINWLRGRLRDLVGAFRIRGEEPPPARPIPERAARILNGFDV